MIEIELEIIFNVRTICKAAKAAKAPKLNPNIVKNALPMDSLKNDHLKMFPARINEKHIKSNHTKNKINFKAKFCIFFKLPIMYLSFINLLKLPFEKKTYNIAESKIGLIKNKLKLYCSILIKNSLNLQSCLRLRRSSSSRIYFRSV